MKEWVKYRNGNYDVILNTKNGTKIRKNDLDFFAPETAESIDLKITNSCDMGCAFCLKPSAKLIVGDSTKSISEICVGDKVLSYNSETNKTELREVLKLYERDYTGDLIVIEDEFGHILKCTPNHKVLTQRGYVRADELLESDVLVSLGDN